MQNNWRENNTITVWHLNAMPTPNDRLKQSLRTLYLSFFLYVHKIAANLLFSSNSHQICYGGHFFSCVKIAYFFFNYESLFPVNFVVRSVTTCVCVKRKKKIVNAYTKRKPSNVHFVHFAQYLFFFCIDSYMQSNF